MSSETGADELAGRVDALETRVAALEDGSARRADRLDELDAGLQAVRGFLGGVDAVNEAVERRADAAIAAVERLEAAVEASDRDGPSLEVAAHTTGQPTDGANERPAQNEAENESPSSNSLRDRLRTLR